MPYIMRDKWLNGLMDRGKCHCVNIAVVSSSDHGFSAAYRFDLKTVSTWCISLETMPFTAISVQICEFSGTR